MTKRQEFCASANWRHICSHQSDVKNKLTCFSLQTHRMCEGLCFWFLPFLVCKRHHCRLLLRLCLFFCEKVNDGCQLSKHSTVLQLCNTVVLESFHISILECADTQMVSSSQLIKPCMKWSLTSWCPCTNHMQKITTMQNWQKQKDCLRLVFIRDFLLKAPETCLHWGRCLERNKRKLFHQEWDESGTVHFWPPPLFSVSSDHWFQDWVRQNHQKVTLFQGAQPLDTRHAWPFVTTRADIHPKQENQFVRFSMGEHNSVAQVWMTPFIHKKVSCILASCLGRLQRRLSFPSVIAIYHSAIMWKEFFC